MNTNTSFDDRLVLYKISKKSHSYFKTNGISKTPCVQDFGVIVKEDTNNEKVILVVMVRLFFSFCVCLLFSFFDVPLNIFYRRYIFAGGKGTKKT